MAQNTNNARGAADSGEYKMHLPPNVLLDGYIKRIDKIMYHFCNKTAYFLLQMNKKIAKQL